MARRRERAGTLPAIARRLHTPHPWRLALAIAGSQLVLGALAFVAAVQEAASTLVAPLAVSAVAACIVAPIIAAHRCGLLRGALSQALFLAGLYLVVGTTAGPSCDWEMSSTDTPRGAAAASPPALDCSSADLITSWDAAQFVTSIGAVNALIWLGIGALPWGRSGAAAPGESNAARDTSSQTTGW